MLARAISFGLLLLFVSFTGMNAEEGGDRLQLLLPTDNTALFTGEGADFYQYVTRNYRGVTSTPWQGGRYGFVRNPHEVGAGLIYTRFHEGIDIKPLRRDASGEPLDEVRAIADGKVVHVNLVPGYSNYGKYVVIEHRWAGSPYYSLYGHLASVAVQTGARLPAGGTIGIMGYTGEGLDRARAHTHLELNLLLSRQFERWHAANFKAEPNRHGLYNGLNLAGIDIARLYQALRKEPSLTLPEFLAREEIFYKVSVPASRSFELPSRYPWLVRGNSEADVKSWEISFNKGGVPLAIEPAQTIVAEPEITYVKRSAINYSYLTRGVLGGSGDRPTLSESGKRLMQLLTFPQ